MTVRRPLTGQVALVAGATRGAGRGIALELALAGAKVYCTGRSSRARPTTRPANAGPFELAGRPETIEETADLIRAAGGDAVALRVDHSRPDEVEALIATIARDDHRLDLLVNDVWGGDALVDWGTPLWQCDLERGFALMRQAVDTHIITSRFALPLMRAGRGMIVEITDGAGHYYRSTLFYDLAKATVVRLAFALAEELRADGLTSVVVSPGFLRSEAMLEHLGVTADTWREGVARDPHFACSESPRYVGRGIAALAADPARFAESGRGFASWHLMRRYGFTDVDGAQPDWGAHAAGETFGADQAASHARFAAMFPPL